MLGRKKQTGGFLYTGINNRLIKSAGKNKDNRALIKRKLVVTVTSLKPGTGCSYVGMSISNFLSDVGKEKTCFLHRGCSYVDSILDEKVDSIYFPCNMGQIYSDYGYIIYDGGIITSKEFDRNMIDRSDIKVMLCWPNEEYVKLLGEFVKKREDISNWVFLFNQVPDDKISYVYNLMEAYSCTLLPIYNASRHDKRVWDLFETIFYDR